VDRSPGNVHTEVCTAIDGKRLIRENLTFISKYLDTPGSAPYIAHPRKGFEIFQVLVAGASRLPKRESEARKGLTEQLKQEKLKFLSSDSGFILATPEVRRRPGWAPDRGSRSGIRFLEN